MRPGDLIWCLQAMHALFSQEYVVLEDVFYREIFFLMEASRCAYKRNIILNSVRQHNYFITQGTYIGYMFRL